MGITALRHVGITVSDMTRALVFYGDFLGLKKVAEHRAVTGDYIASLVGVPGASIDITILGADDGSRLELLCYRSHAAAAGAAAQATEPGRPHVAFSVADLGKLYDQRAEAGCVFKHPPQVSPDGKVLVAYCHDPDGTILELVQPLDTTGRTA